MSTEEAIKKLESMKEKRKMYNKKYYDKIKQKLEMVNEIEQKSESENNETQSDQPADFFFQPKQKTTQKQQAQREPEIILKMPETSISTQIKNQIIMGSLAIIPMLCSALFKIYEKKQNNSLPNQSTNQSAKPLEMQQQLSFLPF